MYKLFTISQVRSFLGKKKKEILTSILESKEKGKREFVVRGE